MVSKTLVFTSPQQAQNQTGHYTKYIGLLKKIEAFNEAISTICKITLLISLLWLNYQ